MQEIDTSYLKWRSYLWISKNYLIARYFLSGLLKYFSEDTDLILDSLDEAILYQYYRSIMGSGELNLIVRSDSYLYQSRRVCTLVCSGSYL